MQLYVAYNPLPIPDPKPVFKCLLCQDEYQVVILHEAHSYCMRCLNGWANLECDLK